MTLDEKLNNFYQSAINDATEQSMKMIETYEQSLEKITNEKKETLKKEAEERLQAETDNLIREKNKNLSSEAIRLKRELSEKTAEKVDSLFIDINKKLQSYMKTPAYTDFLIQKITEAITFAGNDDLTIYINPTDSSLKDVIEEKVKKEITISTTDFMGGIRCVIPNRHILIDHSFLSKLKEEKANFKLE